MKNTTNSKEKINESLFKLMEKYNYKELTVSEIAANANISRRTFYRLFKEKDDILKYYFDNLTETAEKNFQEKVTNQTNLNNILNNFFYFWWLNKNKIKILINQQLFIQFMSKMSLKSFGFRKWIMLQHESYPEYYNNKNNPSYMMYFFVGGYINLLNYWLSSENPINPEKLTELVCNSLENIKNISDEQKKL